MKEYKYKINGNEYSVAIIDLEGDKAAVEVNGVSYQVDILTEGYTAPAPRPAAKPAAAPAPAPEPAPAPAPADDAGKDDQQAQNALASATMRTVNRINSDGCMSTNDTVLLLASGASGTTPSRAELDEALTEVMSRLGRRLVADAEGATHDIAITVSGAVSEEAAEAAARTVSSSNLLKCAVAGADPNWGRILSQLGTVPEDVCPFNPDEVDVAINGITIFSHGAPQLNREAVDMSPRETRIDIDLSAGRAEATVWTNDLTHGYVTINADYTT